MNTIPPATVQRSSANTAGSAPALTGDVETAADTMEALEKAGISMKAVTDKLLADGLSQFVDAFAQLLKATGSRKTADSSAKIDSISYTLPKKLSAAVDAALTDWAKNDKVRRLWRADASLWTNADENHWLGWLGITDDAR